MRKVTKFLLFLSGNKKSWIAILLIFIFSKYSIYDVTAFKGSKGVKVFVTISKYVFKIINGAGKGSNFIKKSTLSLLYQFFLHFYQDYNSKRSEPDYTVGIFQSIGFKEFHEVSMSLHSTCFSSRCFHFTEKCCLFNQQVKQVQTARVIRGR